MDGALVAEADRLRELVNVDPGAAAERARTLLDTPAPADPEVTARLMWVIGLASRETGRFREARRELFDAVDAANTAGDCELAARISSSLAIAVAHLGDLDQALSLLRTAEPHVTGAERARIEGQLGTVLYWRGELTEAARHLRSSVDALTIAGDRLAEARYRGNLGGVLALQGDVVGAQEHLNLATVLAERQGLDMIAGVARANLGFVATLRGDLPGALHEFELAETIYRRANANSLLPRLHADHAQALADAGLFEDADSLVHVGIEMYDAQGQETELAGALLTSAEIRLARGDLEGAISAATDAATRFASQGRESWALLAQALALQGMARQPSSDGPHLADQLVGVARTLTPYGWDREATRCRLVAARLMADAGAPLPIDAAFRAAVSAGRSADRILLAYVDATSALSRPDPAAARRAITLGVRIATSMQAELGSIEMRAHAAFYASELTVLGARIAVADGRPRELLERIEASRVLSSRTPSVRPPDDEEIATMLAELRSLDMAIADPSTSTEQRLDAEGRRTRLERDVGRRARAARGEGRDAVGIPAEVASALTLLGGRQVLAHAALDGQLLAVTIGDGRARLHDLGPLEQVREQLDSITFALHRLNRAKGSDDSRLAAAEMMHMTAFQLAEQVIPPDVAASDAPVVLVPTGALHDVPWGLLPPFAGRAVSINPSLSAWARAERSRIARFENRGPMLRAGFIGGPGLDFAETEVELLSDLYHEPTTLVGPAATSDACCGLLGSCDLVHVACHGSFRRDNPMFSALHVADGPLNIYDFERLDRLPEIVVLSACSVAGAKELQGGSLLGLAAAMTTFGANSVIAPLTPISDASSVTVMQRLHRALVAGASPPAALAAATISHDVADPTAAAFIALGA